VSRKLIFRSSAVMWIASGAVQYSGLDAQSRVHNNGPLSGLANLLIPAVIPMSAVSI
jgi:hypothetical protein